MEKWVEDQKYSVRDDKVIPSIANVMGKHFNLYSTFEDAWNNHNPWLVCKYNENNIGFPCRCGPVHSVDY
jgi:hypothetical protein